MAKKVEESAKLQLFLDLLEELLSDRFSLSNTMCSICFNIYDVQTTKNNNVKDM
jgi:hypothetical protein